MMILRGGGHDFFLLGFRGGLSKISSYVEERIRGGGHRKIGEIFNHCLLM